MANHPTSPSRAGASSRAFHPTDYLRVLYKRRWVAIPGFLIVFLSGAIGSIRTVPVFEARTQVLIEKDARRNSSLGSVLDDQNGWYEDDFLPTQFKVLQSRALALRTAKELERTFRPESVPPAPGISFSISGLVGVAFSSVKSLFVSAPPPQAATPSPGAAAPLATDTKLSTPQILPADALKADRISSGTIVTPVRLTRLVELKFRSPDPEYAAAAVNALANQYIQQNTEFRMAATSQTSNYLVTQVEEQKKAVADSDAKLQRYKEEHNAGSVDDKQNIVVQKLTALNQQLVDAKIDLVNKEVEYRQVQALQASGEPLDALPIVMQDESVRKLKTDLSAKEAARDRLTAQGLGPALPAVQSARREVDNAREELSLEIRKVVSGIKSQYETAKMKADELQRSVNTQSGEAMGLDRKALEYSALKTESDSNHRLLDTLMAKSKEAGSASEYRGTNIQVLDRAEVPRSPVLPQTERDLLVAMMGGVVLAIVLAFGFEYFDSRIKAPDEIKQHLDVPFLGMIPTVGGKDHNGEAPLLHGDATPAFSEAIRAIRTAVLFSSAEEGARSILVTSTGPHEGKTLVSSSLAITLAQAGQRTLVIDADMRRPRMHEALGRSQEPGLSNVLVGESSLADAARATSVPNLSLLAAGHIPLNPAELLGSRKYLELLTELKKRYDWIVVDAPPVMPVTDAAVIAHATGGVLFVIGSEMTPRQSAAAAIEQLRSANATFVGAVLNRVNIQRHSYYYSPYYRKEYAKYYQRSGSQA